MKFNQLQKNIDYSFKNQKLLTEAMTHKSFCIAENRNLPHNERLEFLGDAIIGLVVAENLMNLFPDDAEGALSKKRASLVNQDTLCTKSKNFKLNEFLIMGPGEKEQKSNLKPRLLASAFEAIIGAIYMDSDFATVKSWINAVLNIDIKEIKPDLEFEKDYKTRLQEITQKLGQGTPIYELVSATGPSHKPEFLVSLQLAKQEKVRSTGQSKKQAEQKAAQIMINELAKNNKKVQK